MGRLYQAVNQNADLRESNAQLLFTGGHGGFVTYDGLGGAMVKRGGPIDRLFMLSNDGRLLGDAGLDIDYGHIQFATGALEDSVSIVEDATQNTGVHYRFGRNEDPSAATVFGSIPLLGIQPETVLVSGNVAPSVMVHAPGDSVGGRPTLPYVAFHPNVTVKSDILAWFGIPNAAVLGAETGWSKLAPEAIASARTTPDLGIIAVPQTGEFKKA